MTNSRSKLADLLKGIAVILMIQVHILELFASQEIFDSHLGSILLFLGGPPAAPVFMIVMGYFIAQGNKNINNTLVRGIKIIGLGLLLNLGLNLHLFIKIYNRIIVTSPWPYLFGVDILFLAGISIIIIGVIRPLFKNNPLLYILLIISVFLIGNYIPAHSGSNSITYITSFFYGNNWWSYFPVIPWLAYPITGVLFYIIEHKLTIITSSKLYSVGIVIVSGIILFFTINYGIRIASNLNSYYHHTYLYFLFIANFMIFWTNLMKLISSFPKNRITTYLQWMGKNVTVFYIVQWIIIGNVATGLYKTQSGIQSFLWFLLIVALTSLITYLYIIVKPKIFVSKNIA